MLYTYCCVITNIVDGDTIDIDIDLGFNHWMKDQRVRLSGVDTPEVRTRDLVEKEFGNLATEVVTGLLPVGTRTILRSKEYNERGSFQRILGDFETDAGWLSEVLLERRLAVEWNPQDREGMKLSEQANYQWLLEQGYVDADRAARIRSLMEQQDQE